MLTLGDHNQGQDLISSHMTLPLTPSLTHLNDMRVLGALTIKDKGWDMNIP